MFSLTIVSPTYQTIDSAPIRMVETCGVRKRGWMRPSDSGIAFARAIDSDVRAVGRIVVCVEAAADVSTAMISSLSSGEPRTAEPSSLKTSSELSISACGTVEGLGRDGDDHVDRQQDEGADDGGAAGRLVGVLALLVDGDRAVPAPVDEDRRAAPR